MLVSIPLHAVDSRNVLDPVTDDVGRKAGILSTYHRVDYRQTTIHIHTHTVFIQFTYDFGINYSFEETKKKKIHKIS